MSEDGGGIVSSRAPEPVGAYPHARRVGNLLFLSGIGPRKRGTREIPGVTLDEVGNVVKYDIEVQCRSVFENVRAVLEDAGSSWEKIVDVTVFLTNMKSDFPVFNRLYAEHFKSNRPTRTTLEVGSLPTPIAVELKVIATID
jgi:reactive intermediate/imine deaminase